MPTLRVLLLCGCAVFAAGATCNARPLDELPKGADPTHEALAIGDIVEVQVYNEPDLSGPHTIESNGKMRLPLIGDVDAAGQTLDALQTNVQAAYNTKFLKNGQVSIKLIESTTLTVYVLGEVARPGPYPFKGHMTLLHAIALAGGTTKLSDNGHMQLTRKDDKGEKVLVLVDFAAIRNGDKPDVEMQPGDVIFVPETPV